MRTAFLSGHTAKHEGRFCSRSSGCHQRRPGRRSIVGVAPAPPNLYFFWPREECLGNVKNGNGSQILDHRQRAREILNKPLSDQYWQEEAKASRWMRPSSSSPTSLAVRPEISWPKSAIKRTHIPTKSAPKGAFFMTWLWFLQSSEARRPRACARTGQVCWALILSLLKVALKAVPQVAPQGLLWPHQAELLSRVQRVHQHSHLVASTSAKPPIKAMEVQSLPIAKRITPT